MATNYNPSANARRVYQEQKEALEKALDTEETELKHMVRSHLRNAIENLNQLDNGTHFTQQTDSLASEIVTGELNATKKVIRK